MSEKVPVLLDSTEAAKVLGICLATLRRWHARGDAPPAIRLGRGRTVRYLAEDLARFVEERREITAPKAA